MGFLFLFKQVSRRRAEERISIAFKSAKILRQVNKVKYLRTVLAHNGKMNKEIMERRNAMARLFNKIKTTFLGDTGLSPRKLEQKYIKNPFANSES